MAEEKTWDEVETFIHTMLDDEYADLVVVGILMTQVLTPESALDWLQKEVEALGGVEPSKLLLSGSGTKKLLSALYRLVEGSPPT